MAQIFQPRANFIARGSVLLLLLLLGLGLSVLVTFNRYTYVSEVNVTVAQPVPFSHAHHVAGLGIDCRYCHSTVERSSFAGMPSTSTCMNCHSQIWTEADMLAPVRQSWAANTPIAWQRIYDLPDFVYFDHSIHVNAGVGCATCHGQINQMPLTYQATTLFMEWCLQCHRNPAPRLRPRDEVFNMDWQPPANQAEMGRRLMEQYHISTEGLTDCTICHR